MEVEVKVSGGGGEWIYLLYYGICYLHLIMHNALSL